MWAFSPDYFSCFNEIESIIIMFTHTSGDCEYVQIEYYILRWESSLLSEQLVSSLAYPDLVLDRGSLALLVEGHDHDGCAVLEDGLGFVQEFFLAFFQGDGVHHAFPLAVLEACFYHFEFGRINHHRNISNLRIRLQQSLELNHSLHSINHTIVQVYIQYLSAVFYLVFCHLQSSFIFTLLD